MTGTMRTRSRLALVAALPLIAALGLTACGSSTATPQVATAGSGSAASTAVSADDQARKLADCLRGEGLILTEGTNGQLVIDKQKNPIDKISAASEKCRQYQPAASAPPKISASDLEAKRRYSVCLRDHGVPDYPDPDPATGEPKLSDALAARLKSDPALTRAIETCRSTLPSSTQSGVAGA